MSGRLPEATKDPETATVPEAPTRFLRWHKRVLSFCMIAFALELGLFLALYPWSGKWDLNFIPARLPQLADVWMNPFFRGAVSGLGLLDVWVAASEFKRLVKRMVGN